MWAIARRWDAIDRTLDPRINNEEENGKEKSDYSRSPDLNAKIMNRIWKEGTSRPYIPGSLHRTVLNRLTDWIDQLMANAQLVNPRWRSVACLRIDEALKVFSVRSTRAPRRLTWKLCRQVWRYALSTRQPRNMTRTTRQEAESEVPEMWLEECRGEIETECENRHGNPKDVSGTFERMSLGHLSSAFGRLLGVLSAASRARVVSVQFRRVRSSVPRQTRENSPPKVIYVTLFVKLDDSDVSLRFSRIRSVENRELNEIAKRFRFPCKLQEAREQNRKVDCCSRNAHAHEDFIYDRLT